MYDTVLVPTDGSEASDAAVEHAFELAAAFDADVHGVYAVDVAPGVVAAGVGGVEPTIEESVRETGDQLLRDLAERAAERGVGFERTLETGAPHDVIADAVAAVEPDVVVMGTHGRSGLDRQLLGSTAERTVRGTDVPVLTVPPA